MKRFLPFLLLLSALCTGSVFADSDSATCGVSQDGKSIDTEYVVCPQNIGQNLKYSFLGSATFGEVNNNTGVLNRSAAIEDGLSHGQKNINASNQYTVSTIVMLAWGIALFLCTFHLAAMVIAYFKAGLSGELQEQEGKPARYKTWGLYTLATSVAGFGMLMPGLFGVNHVLSAGAYGLIAASNASAEAEAQIIGRFLNRQISGNLEHTEATDTLKDYREKKENSHTYYSAQATIAGLISTSLLISNTSAFNNAIDNLKVHDASWKVRDVTADVWQPNNQDGISFEKRFSEDPNQRMWATDAVTFAKNPTDIGDTLSYLKAVNYNKSYRDFDDIDALESQATKLMSDIRTTSFYDNQAGFQEIKESAASLFFKDAQANIMRKNFLQWMVKSDEIADLTVNYACSKSLGDRMAAQNFIDAHTKPDSPNGSGNPSCVDNNWKVMGLGQTDQYATQIHDKTNALIDEYYNTRLKINTQYHNSVFNQDLFRRQIESYQKGFLHLVWTMPAMSDEANFSATAQNQFGSSSPMTTIQTQAVGTYIIDDWARKHGYGDGTTYNSLNMGEVVRELNLIPNSDGAPSLSDSAAIMQKAYSTNATASAQQADFYEAIGVGLENPKVELDACVNTTKYPVTCMQKYGQQISETMTQIMYLAATTKLIGYAATAYGDKKKVRVMSDQAKAEENAGVSKDKIKKNQKKLSKTPNFMQIVGAITGGLASFFFTWALKGYMLATMLKFLVISIMTGPFFLLYVLNIFYLLLLIVTMPFAILAFFKLNDRDNLMRIGSTMLGILFSTIVFGPLIVFFYVSNWEIAAALDQSIMKYATNGLGPAVGQTANVITQKMIEIVVSGVIFFIAHISCTKYAIKMLAQSVAVMDLKIPHLQYANLLLQRIELMCGVATVGMYTIVNAIADRKTAIGAYRLLSKLGRKYRPNRR
ncbi:putative Membrane protein [Pseudomonas syringae pv. broussonetiae]|uniref:Putative Membrane protein n=1 Tax=Pseudomonas savastanoi TaxID=29438 RepID=A0A3M5J3I4_PSESS|nr:ABC transporter permease [Pseudomonas savastanoi]KPW47337.1 putative Membrane protein [Pseudomonas syringae pv. broussonetiae]KWT09174.1 hypothetical protein AL047_17335 [Pseudomonas syringae pv. broussonetiae]RMS22414.1 putative Membrane protein [Pseudomonas savastanoi]RMT17928.1 putative Membrane protein [Pseudomonas savastanoi]